MLIALEQAPKRKRSFEASFAIVGISVATLLPNEQYLACDGASRSCCAPRWLAMR